jgi:Protein of unknown function (DUF3800)
VHLAYIDDSDTKSKRKVWQVMAAVIIEDKAFTLLEHALYSIREDLLPLMSEEKRCKFEEFHASELYGGYGAFDGIDQDRRLEAITKLLHTLTMCELAVVYGAVNVELLQKQLYASADPIDISFRICLKGIKSWIDERILGDTNDLADLSAEGALEKVTHLWLRELVIVVVDECDSRIKNSLYKTFRTLRAATATSFGPGSELVHFHDDMYFGDSRYSIGIQLADLCAYFIARHLEGDMEIQGFYEMVSPHIVFSQVHPNVPEAFDRLPERNEKPDEANI